MDLRPASFFTHVPHGLGRPHRPRRAAALSHSQQPPPGPYGPAANVFLPGRAHAPAIACLNTITWVVGVGYGLFHVMLNLLAELVGFGDRRFYGRWWEAATFGKFWKVWRVD